MRITTVRPVAQRNRRNASELARIGRGEQIAETAHRLNHVDAELFADAPDKHLDGVGVAVEILVVKMLDQFGARHDPPGMVHQIRQQPVFVRRQLDRIAVDGDAPGAGVETNRPAGEFALGVTGGSAQPRARAVRTRTARARRAPRQDSSTEMPSIFDKPISRITASYGSLSPR